MENNKIENDAEENNKTEEMQLHAFSSGYMEQKRHLLQGLQDVESIGGRSVSIVKASRAARLARVAVVLLCGVILIPVSIHAAVTMYNFTVERNGIDARGTIQLGTSTDAYNDPDDVGVVSGTEKEKPVYVDVRLSYLPDDFIQTEECKYSAPGHRGISFFVEAWDGQPYKVFDRGVAETQSLKAGTHEYLLFTRGDADADFDRVLYIPVKEQSVIVVLYVEKGTTDDEMNQIVSGMIVSENTDKNSVNKQYIYYENILGDSSESDMEAAYIDSITYTFLNKGEDFDMAGYNVKLHDIRVCDNIRDIDKSDIYYHFSRGLDSRYVDENGSFKVVKCRRLNEGNKIDTFSCWGEFNEGRLCLVEVKGTYKCEQSDLAGDHMVVSLQRGKKDGDNGLDIPDTTNYEWLGDEGNDSRKLTDENPVIAMTDGETDIIVDGLYSLNSDEDTHEFALYFLVDRSELKDAYVTFDAYYDGRYNSDYKTFYIGERAIEGE